MLNSKKEKNMPVSFFDSPPTKQSRLCTFRCPYRQEHDELEHNITIAWKGQTGGNDEVEILVENVPYRGKPLILAPSAIKGHTGEFLPAGTLYTACSCMAKKGAKIRYVATEVLDTTQPSGGGGDEHLSKITKKISKDLFASTQMLIQLHDDIEGFVNSQKKFTEDLPGSLLAKLQPLYGSFMADILLQTLQDIFALYEARMIELLKPLAKAMSTELPQLEPAKPVVIDPAKLGQVEIAPKTPESSSPSDETQDMIEVPQPELTVETKEAKGKSGPAKEIRIHRIRTLHNPAEEETSAPAPTGESLNSAFAKLMESPEEDDEKSKPLYQPSLGVTRVIEAAMYKKAWESAAQDEVPMLDDMPKPPSKKPIDKKPDEEQQAD